VGTQVVNDDDDGDDDDDDGDDDDDDDDDDERVEVHRLDSRGASHHGWALKESTPCYMFLKPLIKVLPTYCPSPL
jgi:hypothetical protein